MSKFTPGPWKEHHNSAPDWEGTWYINGLSKSNHQQLIVMGEGWSEEHRANAKLIAIAPDMYKFLIDFSKVPDATLIELKGWQEEAAKIIKGFG